MFNKKLLFIIFTLNIVFFSAALIRDWNRRLWHANSAYIGRETTPVTRTRLDDPLQAAKLSKERRIAASRAFVESVNAPVVRKSDQVLEALNSSFSTAQAPAPKLPDQEPFNAGSSGAALPVDVAVVLFCFDREGYLETTLQSLAGLRGLQDITLYISQDGEHQGVRSLVERVAAKSFGQSAVRHFEHWEHRRTPLLGNGQPGHAWLSQHYKWGLDRVFLERGHSHVIIVEDDMIFSPDFLTLFQESAPLLAQDPSIWCVSSWNDNGQAALDWDPQKLYRTSYFPGLGWMMRRELWLEIGPQFPVQAWDHWMRLNTTSKGRDCIVPEVNRNKNIGEKGVNMNVLTFKKYLAKMNWEERGVASFGDLAYLTAEQYNASIAQLAASAVLWENGNLKDAHFVRGQVYLVPYKVEDYKDLVAPLKIWPFPRGHFHGLTRIPVRGAVLLLADRRVCPYLPIDLEIHPADTLRAVAGLQALDCDSTCREDNFWFINSCSVLRRHFRCERGCAVELGPDIPNYVMDPSLRTYQTCLVSQAQPSCSATHKATARLCPCT